MRSIDTHIVAGDGAPQIEVMVLDEPGPGGANHVYGLVLPTESETGREGTMIRFQYGAIKEVGVNGLTHEALLAVVIDRLQAFQAGPFACADNAEALEATEKALECLQRRTLARIARGVEGKNVA